MSEKQTEKYFQVMVGSQIKCRTFGQCLRDFRRSFRWSQSALAKQLGITKQAVSNYETGKTSPRINQLLRYAELLQIPVDILLGTKDSFLMQPILSKDTYAVALAYELADAKEQAFVRLTLGILPPDKMQ